MATARLLRRQAATCAALAKQTHDEESRERCLWLEQTYLQLAETEEQLVGRMSAFTGERERKSSPDDVATK
jgi:hypothetical protein